MPDLDVDAVSSLIRHVAATELLPRFGALHANEVFSKATVEDPGDIVTEADLAAERALGPALQALLPGSVVIGEEAVAANADVIELLRGDRPAWLVDPLDGTRNFAEGRDTFGVIVALCEGGAARAGWIHLPVPGVLLAAQSGAGAWDDGVRVAEPAPARDSARLRGTIYTRFMPPELRVAIMARAGHAVNLLDGMGSAASEYTSLVRGEKDFVLYHRLLPWDHAAGSLIITEAGGAARHGDGRPYRASDRDPLSLVTNSAAHWEATSRALFGDGA